MQNAILSTSIQTSLKRRLLFRGTLLSIVGLLPLIASGIWLSQEKLQFLGLPLFLLAFCTLAIGLIPYRKILQLELHPYTLSISSHALLYSEKKMLFTIPLKSISKIEWIEKDAIYGIGITLKKNLTERVIVHEPIDMEEIQKKSRSSFGTDFFLPYFNKRACNELCTYVS